ncbi:MAG: LPXTG cell wall anchor domain-containing protein [Actinobacteria bacterium]|nr:LPXTG cell wall anchor domain-containing protein [Actinomycetota bacterium]
MALTTTRPAGAVATAPSNSSWNGYSTGSAVHINALQLAANGPIVADTALAFAGASVNSRGLSTPLTNEMLLGVHPAQGANEAFGRGSGVEVGVVQNAPNNPDANQVKLGGGAAEASAAPPLQTDLVTKELLKQTINPLAYASVLRGQAQATFNERFVMPMLGSPLGFGLGYADDVQLLNAGPAPTGETLPAPVLATDTTAVRGGEGPFRTTSQSSSFTYLVNNGDGTCGLASETHVTMAPVRLNLPPDSNPANDITIEVLGEWVLRVAASGKPGGGKVEYMPTGDPAPGPTTPIVRIFQGQTVTAQLTTQQLPLFGEPGLVLPDALAPLIAAAVGENPRAIAPPGTNPNAASQPIVTDTLVAAAVDVARVRLVQPTPTASGLNALDFRLGHMESKVEVPEGGINCEIPVVKTASPDPAGAGQDLTFTISIPADADALRPFPCDLTNIRVTDTVSRESGNPIFTVVGGTGPNGEQGVVSGNTVTFDNIGSYRVGDPPLLVNVTVRLAGNSGAGRLLDTVKVDATPANCRAGNETVGRVLGGARFFGANAGLTGAGVTGGGAGGGGLTGTFTLSGPDVGAPAALPRTGPVTDSTTALILGLGAAAGGILLRRTRRLAA